MQITSYWINFTGPVSGTTLEIDAPHLMRGGTYAVGGTTMLELNVTYNYGFLYRRDDVFGEKGIRTIYGMTGAESIPALKKAATALGNDTNPDYWEPTEGTTKKPLLQLLAMAQMKPDGVREED